ncbi:hypothetical protein AAE478_000146 [Parahypoxylon ruwenzoriense]
MLHFRDPLRALHLAALLATIASATAIRPDMIFKRADGDNGTCAADFTRCAQSGLPDNFCCPSGSTCIVLAGNTTVVCCPEGSTCKAISPIICDLTQQDAATNPQAEVKTTVLNGKLETCGAACCPFGYHCKDNKDCVMDDDQSQKPAVPSPSTTSAPASSSTAASTSPHSTIQVVDGTATPSPSKETPSESTSSTTNIVSIVGGVIGGLAGLLLIIAIVFFLRLRRKRKAAKQRRRESSTSSFGNIISAPVPHANYPNQRLDFLAKQAPTSPRSGASSPTAVAAMTPPRQRDLEKDTGGPFFPPNSPYSPYARRPDSEMSDVPRSYHASAEITGLRSLTHWNGNNGSSSSSNNRRPPTPPREIRQNSGGSESINIFADPITFGGRPDSAATTWSNIQQRADRNRSRLPGRPTKLI